MLVMQGGPRERFSSPPSLLCCIPRGGSGFGTFVPAATVCGVSETLVATDEPVDDQADLSGLAEKVQGKCKAEIFLAH